MGGRVRQSTGAGKVLREESEREVVTGNWEV